MADKRSSKQLKISSPIVSSSSPIVRTTKIEKIAKNKEIKISSPRVHGKNKNVFPNKISNKKKEIKISSPRVSMKHTKKEKKSTTPKLKNKQRKDRKVYDKWITKYLESDQSKAKQDLKDLSKKIRQGHMFAMNPLPDDASASIPVNPVANFLRTSTFTMKFQGHCFRLGSSSKQMFSKYVHMSDSLHICDIASSKNKIYTSENYNLLKAGGMDYDNDPAVFAFKGGVLSEESLRKIKSLKRKPTMIRICTPGHVSVALYFPETKSLEIWDTGPINDVDTNSFCSALFDLLKREIDSSIKMKSVAPDKELQDDIVLKGKDDEITTIQDNHCQTYIYYYTWARCKEGCESWKINQYLQSITPGKRFTLLSNFYSALIRGEDPSHIAGIDRICYAPESYDE